MKWLGSLWRTPFMRVYGMVLIVFLWLLLFQYGDVTGASSRFTNTLGIQFVYIKPGTFVMGSPSGERGREWDEEAHTVHLTKGFYMAITEITQGQYEIVMGKNPSASKNCGNNCPVETVSWEDCQAFLDKLNRMEHTTLYRLPTEAEWEYVCRSGSQLPFCVGDVGEENCDFSKSLDMVAWYCGNSGQTGTVVFDLTVHPVGTKKPNAWGVHDMHGNVMEWCLDKCKGRKWTGLPGVNTPTYVDGVRDPLSTDGVNRVIRGGGFSSKIDRLRSAERSSYKPVAKRNNLGFRIVKSIR